MQDDATERIAKVMELLLDAVCVVDRAGFFMWVGGACEAIFGYRAEEMIGRPMIEFVFPEDRERTLQAASEIMSGVPRQHFRNRYLRKNGTVVHIMWSARSSNDRVRVAVARDITELVRAETLQAAVYAVSEAAHDAEDLVTLFAHIHKIVASLLPARDFFVSLCGDGREELTIPYAVGDGTNAGCASRIEAERLLAELVAAERTLASTKLTDAPAAAARSEIEAGGLEWLGIPLRSRAGILGALLLRSRAEGPRYSHQDRELLQFVSVQIATVIERKQAEMQLLRRAMYDSLTDLPNRSLFHDRLNGARTRSRRNRVRAALLFVDLDDFKAINDRCGHEVGDRLLQEVACRLLACVRDSDTVSRLGGDEFVLILDAVGTPEDALLVASRIRASLCLPFDLTAEPVQISSSIGVALYPDHGSDNEQLLRRADAAMYVAKARGKNAVQLCSERGPT